MHLQLQLDYVAEFKRIPPECFFPNRGTDELSVVPPPGLNFKHATFLATNRVVRFALVRRCRGKHATVSWGFACKNRRKLK